MHPGNFERNLVARLALAGLLLVPATTWAADHDDLRALRDQNAAMRRQLEAQEKRLERLEASEEGSRLGFSAKGFDLSFSGFLKSDFGWNTKELNSTSAPRFASENNNADSQFTSTIQHSRLMLSLDGPEVVQGVRIGGYLEMDFFNFQADEDTNFQNNELRVRQLYATLESDSWRLLVGEVWDLFGPLNPTILNTNGNLWFGGNTGFRRPQIQIQHRFETEDFTFTPAFSFSSNNGTSGDQSLDTGRDSGVPMLQGSVLFELPFREVVQIGVQGVWAEEDDEGTRTDIDKWGFATHAVVPLAEWLTVSGEFHFGRNLNTFLSGGALGTRSRAIASRGGFVQFTVDPTERLETNLVMGIDDRQGGRLTAGDRSSNRVLIVNGKYRLFEHFTVGVEYERFWTDFNSRANQDVDLLWMSGILSF